MVEAEWPNLDGTTVEYGDRTWELTGTVTVKNTGEVLGVEAKRVDDVSQPTATLRFSCEEGSPSLNPGNLGSHFERIERTRTAHYLVVETDQRTYRYELLGLERD